MVNALDGKAVVVTGAGRGLGREYALLAAAEGAAVVVNDIDGYVADSTVERIRAAGGRALAHHADVADWRQAEELVRRCVREHGRIDGLVNNAGRFAMSHAAELNPDQLHLIMETNVFGTVYCGVHAMRAMLEVGRGSIVNVTSGAHAGMAYMSAYAASKGAVASLTYTWAVELAGRGVRVNAISPLADTRLSEVTVAFHGHDELASKGLRAAMPAPAANAPAVVYLLSDAAQAVTGQVLRTEHEALSLMSHPMIMEPVVEGAGGLVDAVAAAFDRTLAARQVPLGLVRASVTPTDAGRRHGEIPPRA